MPVPALEIPFPEGVRPDRAQLFHHAFGCLGVCVAEIDLECLDVDADGDDPTPILEWIFHNTNNIEESWTHGNGRPERIRPTAAVADGARSTSMGDEILLLAHHPDHGVRLPMSRWVCDTVGWTKLPVEKTVS